jgi:hypothetical protein
MVVGRRRFGIAGQEDIDVVAFLLRRLGDQERQGGPGRVFGSAAQVDEKPAHGLLLSPRHTR